MATVSLKAPAKLNLCLEVVGRRRDGFHELRTVFQAVDLADRLTFEPADELRLEIDPASPMPLAQLPVEENLVLKAAELLQKEVGTNAGARILLHKVVPVAAGLGGGSSDAATTLLGLRKLWRLDAPEQQLAQLAGKLGSDVPFFLRGGTALGAGRGDVLTPLPTPSSGWAVVLAPAAPLQPYKTRRMYRALLSSSYSPDAVRTQELVRRLHAGEPLEGAPFNVFEAVAAESDAGYALGRQAFQTVGVRQAVLVGAGPSLFTLAKDQAEATRLCNRLTALGYRAYAVRFLPAWGLDGLPV